MNADWFYDILAPIYDDDMGRNMPFDDIAGYLALLPRAPASMLEIGCGTGRLTIALANRRYSITAIDRSEPMVEQLHRKLRAEHDIRTHVMDAREITLPGTFDAVMFGYSGFQYLLTDSDTKAFCRHARRILAPSAPLILDIFLHRERVAGRHFHLDYERRLADGRTLRRWKRVRVDADVNRVERRYVVAGGQRKQVLRVESRQRLYTPESMIALLDQNGFVFDAGIYDYSVGAETASEESRFFTARFFQRP